MFEEKLLKKFSNKGQKALESKKSEIDGESEVSLNLCLSLFAQIRFLPAEI